MVDAEKPEIVVKQNEQVFNKGCALNKKVFSM
jgi:hypothetical protein